MFSWRFSHKATIFLSVSLLLAWGGWALGLWNWLVALGVPLLLTWFLLLEMVVLRERRQEREKIRKLLKRRP